MLGALDQEITREVESTELLDCDSNDLFRFVSDLGELAAAHPHLQIARDIVGTILVNIRGQRRIDHYALRSKLPPGRLFPILFYLDELQYIKLETEETTEGLKVGDAVIPKGGIIDKAYIAIEASDKWKEHREPNFVLASMLIRGLAQSIGLIEANGRLDLGQGITRVYVSNGYVYIPRQFTAPLMYVLGSWANGRNEFTESDINPFLTARGIGIKEREKIGRVIGGVNPGLQHTIYRVEAFSFGSGIQSFRYILNPVFANLRERLRERERGV